LWLFDAVNDKQMHDFDVAMSWDAIVCKISKYSDLTLLGADPYMFEPGVCYIIL